MRSRGETCARPLMGLAGRVARAVLGPAAVLAVLAGAGGFASAGRADPKPGPAACPHILIVGAYHFVSKANVHTMPVDDPSSARRQREIVDLVGHLARFRPTKIVLEQTSGTSDLELHYAQFLNGAFALPPSENYQVGFRLAKSLGLRQIYTINAFTDFDYGRVADDAARRGQSSLIDAQNHIAEALNRKGAAIEASGTVLDVYRYLNSPEAVRANNSAYMVLARIGDDADFAGAELVAGWHLRNLEMFAKLTRLVRDPGDRILVLYGQGHAYLLQDFVRESPDLCLADTQLYLR